MFLPINYLWRLFIHIFLRHIVSFLYQNKYMMFSQWWYALAPSLTSRSRQEQRPRCECMDMDKLKRLSSGFWTVLLTWSLDHPKMHLNTQPNNDESSSLFSVAVAPTSPEPLPSKETRMRPGFAVSILGENWGTIRSVCCSQVFFQYYNTLLFINRG